MPSIRFHVDHRDVPPIVAARRLGLTLEAFKLLLPELLTKRKFPPPDPTTGNFDLKAIDAWQDARNPQLLGATVKDSSTITRERLKLKFGGAT
jgi:hypothetical protein